MCELPIKLAVPGEFKEPARNRIPLVKTLLLILSLLVLINSSLLASQETKPKKVLVLASYKATAPVAHLWNRGITERKQAELDAQRHRQELTHVSRVATLGELSASLAHELNQPLTAILSNAQAARRFLTGDQADPDEVKELLNDIINDDKRAADIIKRLRALMKRKELAFTSLDLNKVVREVAELLNREAFIKNVSLVLDLAEGLPYVRGDAIHLQQVALNLIINGSEAMETVDHPSGELRILTTKHDENAVRVSVRD